MKHICKLQTIPVVQLLLSIVLIQLMFNYPESYSVTGIVIIGVCLTTLNSILSYIFSNGMWRSILIVLLCFVFYVLIYSFILIVLGNPEKQADQNMGGGLLIILAMVISSGSLVVGNLIGVILHRILNKS